MNLQDITTKPWILALFKRDDGERFLLGDGYFDFKDSLQHFQPNTMANDIVELQGSDGQLLAGQVRRGASQSFDGYIGDGTTTRAIVEERRREFLMFFRKKHFYSVVYIFCDGSAIKRERGYLVDAPSVPEIRQLAPSYHVALNFEDVNYYEYKEDINGNEIYSNIRNVVVSTIMTGGLIWDNLGAVSEAIQWAGKQTATGSYITINDGLANAPMSLTEIDGNATQNGTPTPSAPVAINTVTGEQILTVTGKNLVDNSKFVKGRTDSGVIDYASGTTDLTYTDNSISFTTNANYRGAVSGSIAVASSSVYVVKASSNDNVALFVDSYDKSGAWISRLLNGTVGATPTTFTTQANCGSIRLSFRLDSAGSITISNIQLELGSTATTYEAFKGEEYEVNLGKNLFSFDIGTAGQYPATGLDIDTTSNSVDITASTTTGAQYYDSSFSGFDKAESYTLSFKAKKVLKGTDGTPLIRCTPYGSDDNSTWTNLGNVGENSPVQGTEYSFTKTVTGYKYYRFRFYNNAGTPVTSGEKTSYYDIQLEVGQATDYSPYFTPIELAKIGIYQDKIYKTGGKWYIEKQVGKVVLDGTENWQTPGTYYCSLAKTEAKLTGLSIPSGTPLMMSNNFTCGVNDYGQDKIGRFGAGNSYLNFNYDNTNNTTTFKTWLTSNNTVVYAPLATPTTTEITDATLLAQLNAILPLFGGVNNISLVPKAGAQGEIDIEYYTSIDPGGGYEWEDGGTGGATIINIEGVDAALPIWEITGLATNPTLTNITTGQTITWTGTVPSGQTLIIDMNKQTATMEGANVFAQISGDWLELAPGINRITYSVLGTDQPSTLSWNNIVG